MWEIKGTDIEDELNIYLVSEGLKPAGYATLCPLFLYDEYDIKINAKGTDIYEREDMVLKTETINQFERELAELNIKFLFHKNTSARVDNEFNEKINAEEYTYLIGKDDEALEKLRNATTDNEIGRALGYPEDAVENFNKVIDGEKRDGHYLIVSAAEAKQKGIDVTWMAYICHVPANLDFVGGNVSETSKRQGEHHMEYVRKNNPDLARRVEERFYQIIERYTLYEKKRE